MIEDLKEIQIYGEKFSVTNHKNGVTISSRKWASLYATGSNFIIAYKNLFDTCQKMGEVYKGWSSRKINEEMLELRNFLSNFIV